MSRITAQQARDSLAQAKAADEKLVAAILDRIDARIAAASSDSTFILDVLNLVTVNVKVASQSDLIQTESTKCGPDIVRAIEANLLERGYKIKHQATSRSDPPFNAKFDISWA